MIAEYGGTGDGECHWNVAVPETTIAEESSLLINS